jgi:hypothetical protein
MTERDMGSGEWGVGSGEWGVVVISFVASFVDCGKI